MRSSECLFPRSPSLQQTEGGRGLLCVQVFLVDGLEIGVVTKTMTDGGKLAVDSRGGRRKTFLCLAPASGAVRLRCHPSIPFTHTSPDSLVCAHGRARIRTRRSACQSRHPALPDEDGRTTDPCISHENLVLLQHPRTPLQHLHAPQARRRPPCESRVRAACASSRGLVS